LGINSTAQAKLLATTPGANHYHSRLRLPQALTAGAVWQGAVQSLFRLCSGQLSGLRPCL